MLQRPSRETESNLPRRNREHGSRKPSGHISRAHQGHKEQDLQIKMLKLLVNIQVHAVTMNITVDIPMNLELEYEQLPQYC